MVRVNFSGITEHVFTYLPVGIALPLREAVFHCRCNPPSDWPEEAYSLIGEFKWLLEVEESLS